MNVLLFLSAYFLRYFRYYFRAFTRYEVHSPFVADFIENVLEEGSAEPVFTQIEQARRRLLQDERLLRIKDFGAGSKASAARLRRVSEVARSAPVSPATGRLLYRLCRHFRPSTVLELGASLGISGSYLALGSTGARMISIEGCPDTAAVARETFARLANSSVNLLCGPFREQLPPALEELKQVDLLFIDGDHRLGASVEYVETCLEKAGPQSIFILADIHWSAEMEHAWKALKKHPKVSLSIDLFQMGILFFRPESRIREHYTLIRYGYKPWQIGLRSWLFGPIQAERG